MVASTSQIPVKQLNNGSNFKTMSSQVVKSMTTVITPKLSRLPVASLQKPKPIVTSRSTAAAKEKKKRTVIRRK